MNLRSQMAKSPLRAPLLAGICILALAAAPVFAGATGPTEPPASDVQAEASDGAVQDGAVDQQGPDETDGPNGNVQDGAVDQQGPDETDGPNGNVQDGAVDQQGS